MARIGVSAVLAVLIFGYVINPSASASAEDTDMIINGTSVPAGKYLWQVRLYEDMDDQYGFCGGSIIGPKWVLTAAHCALDEDNRPVEKIVVGYGSVDRTKTKRIESEQVIVNPDYILGEAADVALIKLKSPVQNVPWIGIADAGVDEHMLQPGETVTVTGWGAMWDPYDEAMASLLNELASSPVNFSRKLRDLRQEEIDEKLQFPRQLHEVDIQVISQADCAAKYEEADSTISATEICAMEPGARNDSCYGDSGGPLIVKADNSVGYVQVGVVSWGKECGDRSFPGVYARVSSFNDWIRKQLKQNP